MSVPLWLDDPTILLNKTYITELWVNGNSGTYDIERKINAITRLVILLTILGFLITGNLKIVMSGFITILAYTILYKLGYLKDNTSNISEAFTNPAVYKTLKKHFTNPTETNPMMNVMLPEINERPNRKKAEPAFAPLVAEDINNKTKEQVIKNNDLDPRLFQDLGDKLGFEQSMRHFYTNPITTVPNDQKSFADYCYGNMPSCKEDPMQCSKNQNRLGPHNQ